MTAKTVHKIKLSTEILNRNHFEAELDQNHFEIEFGPKSPF